MGVLDVRRGSDAGAAVVGLGEAGAGGVEISQVLKAWKGQGRGMGPCGLSQG